MVEYLETISKATSVKNIGLITKPTAQNFGLADMQFRPVFSVFDYGTIEPSVPLDNSTICLMAGFNFEMLTENGIPNHYEGLVSADGELLSATDVVNGKFDVPTSLRVQFVNRLLPQFKLHKRESEKGKWDYSMFSNPEVNSYVHPIEFIMRNELPEASSVWKRINDGEVTLADFGLPADFKPGMVIPEPLLDYSTKFEPDDRYLTPDKTREMLGISEERFAQINGTTRAVNKLMTDYAESRGFNRLDGKVEYITLNPSGESQEDVLGDAVCTWHEDRLLWGKLGISKQRIRNEVKALNGEWYNNIQEAKKRAKTEGVEDFKTLMDPNIQYVSPSPEFFHAINDVFRAGTNQWVGQEIYEVFPGKKDSLVDTLNRASEQFEAVKTK